MKEKYDDIRRRKYIGIQHLQDALKMIAASSTHDIRLDNYKNKATQLQTDIESHYMTVDTNYTTLQSLYTEIIDKKQKFDEDVQRAKNLLEQQKDKPDEKDDAEMEQLKQVLTNISTYKNEIKQHTNDIRAICLQNNTDFYSYC